MTRATATDGIVVMGVSGVGKSTVGRALAAELGLPFLEGDDLHPAANVAKMRRGEPLDDQDRWPWLAAVGAWLALHRGVAACSALTHAHRDALRAHAPDACFVHLAGDPTTVSARVARRRGHFMPSTLVPSQYATLEPLTADEHGATFGLGATAAGIAQALRDGGEVSRRPAPGRG